MSACCFFGHRDTPEEVKPALYAAIEELITERGVDVEGCISEYRSEWQFFVQSRLG